MQMYIIHNHILSQASPKKLPWQSQFPVYVLHVPWPLQLVKLPLLSAGHPKKQATLVNKPHDICYNRGGEIKTKKLKTKSNYLLMN